MASATAGNGQAIAAYIAGAHDRALPAAVADMARLCLADWLGVAIGAGEEAAPPPRRSLRWPTVPWRTALISTTPMSRR